MPDESEHIRDAIIKFNRENPDHTALLFNMQDEETRSQMIDFVMGRHKNPKQIVAYETKFQGPYTEGQWHEQRAFIERLYGMGTFNKIFYQGPHGGAHTPIENDAELKFHLDRIEDGFQINPRGTLEYSIGMNLIIKGYEPDRGLIVTNGWDPTT